MSRFEERILRTLAIVLTPVVAGLSLYVFTLWRDFTDNDVFTNGYVPPKYLYSYIEYVRDATVTVRCNTNSGSGFSFELEEEDEANFAFDWENDENSSVIITNFHVVEKCYDENIEFNVQDGTGELIRASILKVDETSDLAALHVPKKIVALHSAWYYFRPGYWVMASGSPFEMYGTVTFGNIIYTEQDRIYTSASLNRGNSGGPLVDNTGYVMGINTGYRAVAQNVNFAIDINALCKQIVECKAKNALLHPNIDDEG